MITLSCTSESSNNLTQSDHLESANITGNVVEAGWDEPAVGATITIEGTELSTTTDMFGAFELKGVPTGEQQLIATYMNQADTLNMVIIDSEHEVQFKLQL